MVKKSWIQNIEWASVVRGDEQLGQTGNLSYFVVTHQQQNTITRRACHPRRDPLKDCFTAAHETGDRLEMVQRNNVEMKKKVRNTKKKK